MTHVSALRWARRRPSLTFGLSGGLFALLFVVATSAPRWVEGNGLPTPSSLEVILIVGGFVGGALVSRVFWTRLGGTRTARRGTLVGALIGLLALAVPMYLLELTAVVQNGIPFDPQSDASVWTAAITTAFVLLATPLALGALAIIPTRGGTVVVGAATGYLLARR